MTLPLLMQKKSGSSSSQRVQRRGRGIATKTLGASKLYNVYCMQSVLSFFTFFPCTLDALM